MKPTLFITYLVMSAGLASFAGDSTTGVISTIAGDGSKGSSGDGGPAISAQLNSIVGIAIDPAGNLYIADNGANNIRKVSPDGVISTAVGRSAGLNPLDVASDAAGNLYVADYDHCRVVKVTPAGAVSTLASKLCFPMAIASDPAGNVYVVTNSFWDIGSDAVHKVSPDGTVSVIHGGLVDSSGLVVDSGGNVYVVSSSRVWRVDPQGSLTILPFNEDASDIAVDGAGNVFVADYSGSRIHKVSPAGIVTTVAGNGTEGFTGDGGPATSAQLNRPTSVTVDNLGNIFVGDSGNRRIRKVTFAIGSETYFPQVAVGGGYRTAFALSNTGDSAISGDLVLTDQQGQPLVANTTGVGEGSSFPVSIAPAGTMFLTVNPLAASDPAKSGWAKLTTVGGILRGVATFHLLSGTELQTAAGVLPSEPTQHATISVDDDYSQGRLTAYALANPTSQNLVIKLALVDQEGKVVDDTVAFTLAPKQQIARYLYQDLARQQFKGSMVLRAQQGGSFVAVALVQYQKLLTVIPVIPGKAPSIPD